MILKFRLLKFFFFEVESCKALAMSCQLQGSRDLIRDIIAVTTESVLILIVAVISISLIKQLNCPSKNIKKPIARFFRIIGTFMGLISCFLSISILLNEILWIYYCKLANILQLNKIVILLNTINMCLIMIIYVGRMYYTFHKTTYNYPNWIYITIVIIVIVAFICAMFGDILWYLNINSLIFGSIIAFSMLLYLIGVTWEVILFIHATNKVN